MNDEYEKDINFAFKRPSSYGICFLSELVGRDKVYL